MPRSRVPTRTPLTHLPGHFYFADLRTSSFEMAEDFYGPLFGWNFLDVSGNIDGQEYRIARIAERDTAGIGLLEEDSDADSTSHWRCYLTVADISATLARAVLLGARVLEPLVRIPGDGALVTLQDPSGATLTLWQYAPGNSSVTVKDDIGAPCWNELHTNDLHAAESFYTDLVGWTYEDGSCNSGHRFAVPSRMDAHQSIAAALVPFGEESRHTGDEAHWRVFFNVHDADDTAEQVTKLGGSILVEPFDWPGFGRAAVLADPGGASFVALRPKSDEH